MKNLLNITFFLSISLVISSCQKEDIEPVGFFEADYYTNPNADQSFFYYFDDGELVAGGLDQYMAAIYSETGTFSEEQLLLLKMRSQFEELPDSIVPWTYFLGLHYEDSINKEVSIDFSLNYPFNNYAHEDFFEEIFFSNNIDKMKLVKVQYTDPPGIYYNPDYVLSIDSFQYHPEEYKVSFKTKETDAIYALCWIEEAFKDSIELQIKTVPNMNTHNVVQNGFRNEGIEEGAVLKNNILYLDYTPLSLSEESSTSSDGWRFEELHLVIKNPSEGMVGHQNIQLDLITTRQASTTNKINTRLLLTNNTQVEIVTWPSIGEYGEIHFEGIMLRESTQLNVNTEFNIKFKRLR